MKPFFIVILAMAAACSKSNLDLTPQQVTDKVTGKWKVTYFFDDKDETSHFTGYTFEFKSGGTLVAEHSSKGTFTGSWSNEDKSSKHGPKLIITISGNEEMEELSDDWEIIVMNDTRMELRDDNKTKTEEVHFEKL